MEVASLPEAPVDQQEEPVAAAEVPNSTLFEWNSNVHVGEGAQQCENPGACDNPGHFHAWLCLANAFQTRDISDKARAAKARKIRALKDDGGDNPENASDSYVTLEAILDDLANTDMPAVIDEVVQESVAKQLTVIYGELREDDRFVNAEQDSEELHRQNLLAEDERDAEEYAQLQKAQQEFAEELERRVTERKDREAEALAALPREKVIELLRKKRINDAASEMFNHAYYTWLMFVGTRQCAHHNARKFASVGELKMAAPEVVRDLRKTINDLESRIHRGSGGSGN